jgi:hypothetical protein
MDYTSNQDPARAVPEFNFLASGEAPAYPPGGDSIAATDMFPAQLVPLLQHERFVHARSDIRGDLLRRRFVLWASTGLRASERLFIPTLSRLALGLSTIDIPFSLGEDAMQLSEIEEKHSFEISRLLIATDSKPHASSVLFLHRSVDPGESNLWGNEVDIAITGMMIAYGLMAQPLSAFIAKDATGPSHSCVLRCSASPLVEWALGLRQVCSWSEIRVDAGRFCSHRS